MDIQPIHALSDMSSNASSPCSSANEDSDDSPRVNNLSKRADTTSLIKKLTKESSLLTAKCHETHRSYRELITQIAKWSIQVATDTQQTFLSQIAKPIITEQSVNPTIPPKKQQIAGHLTTQLALKGTSSSPGKKKFFPAKRVLTVSEIKNYVKPGSQRVLGTIKINGQFHNKGFNRKAYEKLQFAFIELNEPALKENFHAEDWVTNSFLEVIIKLDHATLRSYLSTYFPRSANQIDKDVISIKLNYSPCAECVNTLINFNFFLKKYLGEDHYIFRIKTLRPYSFRSDLKNKNSNQAQAFYTNISKLKKAGIAIKWQSLASIKKMTAGTSIRVQTMDQKLIGKRAQIARWFGSHFLQDTTWKVLGLNRKTPTLASQGQSHLSVQTT